MWKKAEAKAKDRHPAALISSGPLYTTKLGAAYAGDALDLIKLLPPRTINAIITSPPYALHFKKSYGNPNQAEYVDWFLLFAKEFRRVLRPNGSLVVEIGGAWNRGQPTRSLSFRTARQTSPRGRLSFGRRVFLVQPSSDAGSSRMGKCAAPAKTHRLPVEVVKKPEQRHRPHEDSPQPDEKGETTKIIKVRVRKRDFSEVEIPILKPIPVKQSDTAWNTLNWPHDPHRVGFSIRSLGGKIQLYYNAEFPPFLDLKHRMSKKSLEEEFVRRYEIKLVIQTMFTLNYDFVDEEEFTETQRKHIRNLLCATAESLALATKSELEIESKLKSEDGTPMETTVAGNLHEAAAGRESVVSVDAGAIAMAK